MVTIVPIDLDDDFVRDALALGVASQMEQIANALVHEAKELRAGGLVERERLTDALGAAAALADKGPAVLEYAKRFIDQQTGDETGDDDDDE